MTRNILHIDASARGAASDSRQLSQAFVARWLESHPHDRLSTRDITAEPLPHLDETMLSGLMSPADEHSPAQAAAAARVDELVEEFLATDVIVLGVPMYNFGIPSTLKAWIDHVVIAGRSFRYTDDEPVGLAGGKTVFVLSTRGGVYGEGPMDHQVRYLHTVFGFLGIDDVRVIQAEGLAISGRREPTLGAAHAAINETLAATVAATVAAPAPAPAVAVAVAVPAAA